VLNVYAVGKKETSVKQTSTEVVLLVVCIFALCVGIPEIDSKLLKLPVKTLFSLHSLPTEVSVVP
jgi:hypothetical protein